MTTNLISRFQILPAWVIGDFAYYWGDTDPIVFADDAHAIAENIRRQTGTTPNVSCQFVVFPKSLTIESGEPIPVSSAIGVFVTLEDALESIGDTEGLRKIANL